MSFIVGRWRSLVTGALAGLVAAAAVVGPSALASGSRAAPCTKPPAPAKTPAGDSGPGPGPFFAAVKEMVAAGTITGAQSSVLVKEIQAGRIDIHRLVANGTLSAAQAHAVLDRLGAVKRSLAPGNHDGRGAAGARAKKR